MVMRHARVTCMSQFLSLPETSCSIVWTIACFVCMHFTLGVKPTYRSAQTDLQRLRFLSIFVDIYVRL